jgi:hypothetical protein
MPKLMEEFTENFSINDLAQLRVASLEPILPVSKKKLIRAWSVLFRDEVYKFDE